MNPLSLVEIILHVVRQMTGESRAVSKGPGQVTRAILPSDRECRILTYISLVFHVLNLKVALVGRNQSLEMLRGYSADSVLLSSPDPNVALTFLEKTREKVSVTFEPDLLNSDSQFVSVLTVHSSGDRYLRVGLRQGTPPGCVSLLPTPLRPLCWYLQVKSSDEAVILCKTAIGALKLNIGDLQVTKVRAPHLSRTFDLGSCLKP